MEYFSWLHLTDLHRGMREQHWLWPGVREIFFEDLEKLHEKCGPWDLVLFTGDLTQQGSAEEFRKVDGLLKQLWAYFKTLGSLPTLLAVPGNHDLVRPRKNQPAVKLLQQWLHQPDIQKEFWEDAASPYRQVITRAFENYTAWWNQQSLTANELNIGMLPGDFSATITKGEAKLGILGLNTSFLQLTDDEYKGKLALHAKQFHEACKGDGPTWAKHHHVCLLLTHHSPVWLTPESQQHLNEEITARARFASHLCGHMHKTSYREIAEAGTEVRSTWQGHSLFGLEYFGSEHEAQRLHGYTAGKIELYGNKGTILFWPRDARLQGGQRRIVPDFSLELTDNQHTRPKDFELLHPYIAKEKPLFPKSIPNRLHDKMIQEVLDTTHSLKAPLHLETQSNDMHGFADQVADKEQNPYTSRNMIKNCHAFFGRKREIKEIFTNLNQGFQNTSIVGERRIGKSSLLWYISQPEVYEQYTGNGKPFRFIFFDLQRVAGLNQRTFFKLLSEALVKQLPESYAWDFEDFYTYQECFSELVQKACDDFRIVICLDEFETVTSSEDFNRDFLQNLRSYANQGQVAYITSSTEPLDVICGETDHIMGSDFWNIFISPPLYLGLLKETEAHPLITEPSTRAGISFQQSEIDFILEYTGHHPLFLQIMCSNIFGIKKEKREAGVQDEINHVERNQMVSNFFMAASPHFNQIWERLNPFEKNVLMACETFDMAGEHRHAITNLIKRGLLIEDSRLRPFCKSFELFIKEKSGIAPKTSSGSQMSRPEDLPQAWEEHSIAILPRKRPSQFSQLDIYLGQGGQVLLALNGSHNISEFCQNPLRIDTNTIKRFDSRVRNIPIVDDWRLEKQEIGRDVEELFDSIPELSQIYTDGRSIVENDDCFLITFKCPKEMIAFPFEFLNSLSSIDDGLKHLALCHPIRKSILGIRSKKNPPTPKFYIEKDTKMLLVSSNVNGPVHINSRTYMLQEIPGAEREIQHLEDIITDLQQAGKIAFSVDVKYDIPCDEMMALLQSGEYDIIHYSGHGFFAESPESSCLFFWEKPGGNCQDNQISRISALELNTIVERTKIRFIYLSCCQSRATDTVDQLLPNDFLGISHSLVVGGVPAVIAMRWPLSDDAAVLLASSFYKELFAGAGLELALFRARRRVQSKNPNDYNWLSPMLIMQSD